MKKTSFSPIPVSARIYLSVAVLVILSLFLFSFVSAKKLGDDLWQQLGLNKKEGTESIYRSFTSGYLNHYQARNAKNLATGNRVAIAKDLLIYARNYVNSKEFKNLYAAERERAKPSEPELKPLRSRREIQKEEIAKTEKSIKEFEDNLKTLDASTQKTMEPVLDMLKKTLKEYQDPNHQYFDALLLNQKYENEQSVERYKSDLQSWETNYPADPMSIVKGRLQKFLEVTKDVDFDAALKVSNNKKVFTRPEYERKSTEWKQAFRAGREITLVARSFATQWLAELE